LPIAGRSTVSCDGDSPSTDFLSGSLDMENTNRFRLKALNFGLIAFLITLPVLIGIYTLAT
jgi:hypothetical protein